jgi:hypothetical protein
LIMPGFKFYRVKEDADYWQKHGCEGTPPSLALLALTVLAASEMTGFNFYGELRKLLGSKVISEGMPPHFDETIPKLWNQLDWWLDHQKDGALGLSTIRQHKTFVNIGYSLSQSLVRASDRRLLYRFFRAIRLRPDEENVNPKELRALLAVWSKRLGEAGQRLHRLATEDKVSEYADFLLEKMAAKWDGRLQDPQTGARSAHLRLVLHQGPVKLRLGAMCREGDPSELVVRDQKGKFSLTRESTWYEPFPLNEEVTKHLLAEGYELHGDARSFFFEPVGAVPFAFDDDLAEWVSTSSFLYGEKFHLLLRNDIRVKTLDWMADEGLEGELDPAATKHLPAGWFLIRGFRINSRPTTSPPMEVADLLPAGGGGARTRLVGGLPLGLPRTYLTRGVPNLTFPLDGPDPTKFKLTKDAYKPIERQAEEGEFALSAFKNLSAGEYGIETDSSSLTFELFDGVCENPNSSVGEVRTFSGDGSGICGLDVQSETSAEPIAIAAPKDFSVLLGSDSESVTMTRTPRWVSEIAGYLSWTQVDAWSSNGSPIVWVVEGGKGNRVARLVNFLPPVPGGAGTNWSRWIGVAKTPSTGDADAQALWHEYQNAAEVASEDS